MINRDFRAGETPPAPREEILPPPLVRHSCPYCGSRNLARIREGDRYYIECRDCWGRGPAEIEISLAAVSWDHRSEEEWP